MFKKVKALYFSPEILKRIRFSWGLHFLFQFGWVISWVVVTALFVEKFGLKNLLYLFSIEAVLLIFSTIIAHRFLKGISNKKIVNYSAGAIIALLIGSFWLSQAAEHVYILFGLALLAKDVFYPRLRMGLLRNTEELFTPKQAERAIPITESALTVGTVAGAGFLLTMIRFLPEATTQNLFVWWAFPIVLIVALLTFEPKILSELPRLKEEKEEKLYESGESTVKSTFKLFKKTPFLRTLAVLVALQAAVFAMVEFKTISHLEHELHNKVVTTEIAFSPSYLSTSIFQEAKDVSKKFIRVTNQEIHEFSSKVIAHNTLLHDLSALNLLFGVIALFVHFIISPFLLRKKGIIRTMLYYFVGLLLVLPALLFGGSWSIAAVRSYEHGFHSLFSAGYHLSFYSTFAKQREFLRHFLEGIIAPLGVLFGVGIILLLNLFKTQAFFPLALTILVSALILVTKQMIPRYTKLAITNLNSADSLREQMHAVEILGQRGHDMRPATAELCTLLKNQETNPFLREKIILTLQKSQSHHIIPEFSKILERNNGNDEIKIKILEAMLEFESLKNFWESNMFSQHKFLQVLDDLFERTQHEHLKKLIVINIFSHLPADKVVPFFLKTMNSADERIKAVCLRSCGMFNDPDIASYVEPYLDHTNARIRSHALIALWNFQEKESLRIHLAQLFDNNDHESIVAGLYAVGELGDESNLSFVLHYSDCDDSELKLHSLIARAKLKDRTCFEPLMKMLFSDNDAIAQKVFAMLKRIPSEIHEELFSHMQRKIAQQVWDIVGHHPKAETILLLSPERKTYLHRLYLFANKHDDILVLEQA